MSALPAPEPGRLPPEVAEAAAEAGRVEPFILEGAVEAALWPGGPDAHQPNWRRDAECRGVNMMYPGRGESIELQTAMCRRCPVQASCLGDALHHGERDGIWGGTSEKGRRRLRKVLREAGIMGVVGEPAFLAWQEVELEPPDTPDIAVLPRPWPHQTDAVAAIAAEIAMGGRCQVAMATASGKTLVAVWAADALDAHRVLVLVPNLALVAQTAEVWDLYRPASPRLAVCSDSGGAELGLSTTTDPLDVREFMAGDGPRLVFATYASSRVLVDADSPFDLVIADEAHCLAGAVDKVFSCVLRDEIPTARTLYMTATPKRFRKSADVEVVSMDEDGPFGRRVYDYKLSDAVGDGVIADYRVVVAAVERDVFERVAAHPDLEGIDPHLLAGAIAVVRAMGEDGMTSCLSFHNRVERARAFSRLIGPVADALGERPRRPGWSGFVHGGASVRIRRRLLARLADDRTWGVLANAQALGLGIDVPALDAVAIVDPKTSETDILQATGRALRRPHAGKVGTVILPVLLAENVDPDDPLAGCDERSLELVGNVLRALRAHDDDLGVRLDKIRNNGTTGFAVGQHHTPMTSGYLLRKSAAKGLLASRVQLHVPGGATGELAGALALHLVREATPAWEMAFGLLRGWATQNGAARVPQAEIVPAPVARGTFQLGSWCSAQRNLYRRGLLARDRAERLSALPGWQWDPRDDEWWRSFAALRDYVVTKDEYPPHHDGGWRTTHLGVRVASFMLTCRQAYKGELRNYPDRVAALEALPRWVWNARDATWEESFRRLERWLAATGGEWPVGGRSAVDGQDVGRWAAKQRARVRATELGVPITIGAGRKAGDGHLTAERIARLRALPGWTDDATSFRAETWDEHYNRVKRWMSANGRAPTTSTEFEDDNIGLWLNKQRDRYRRGALSEARRVRLEALPDWTWESRADAWTHSLGVLQRHAATAELQGGVLRVPVERIDGVNLTDWCTIQRKQRSLGRLSDDQVAQLEAVRGWAWDVWSAKRLATLEAVRRWLEREGPVDPTTTHREDGVPIRSWIDHWRTEHEAGTLGDGARTFLDDTPGWSWTPLDVKRIEVGRDPLTQQFRRTA